MFARLGKCEAGHVAVNTYVYTRRGGRYRVKGDVFVEGEEMGGGCWMGWMPRTRGVQGLLPSQDCEYYVDPGRRGGGINMVEEPLGVVRNGAVQTL